MPIVELPLGAPGKLFCSPMPFSRYDPENGLLEAYLGAGISTVVMLVSDQEAAAHTGLDLRRRYRESGLQVLHLPVPDMQVPDRESLKRTVEATVQILEAGQHVAVHCHAGQGRTGLFAACLLKSLLGLDGPQAVSRVRERIPAAVETSGQEQFVFTF